MVQYLLSVTPPPLQKMPNKKQLRRTHFSSQTQAKESCHLGKEGLIIAQFQGKKHASWCLPPLQKLASDLTVMDDKKHGDLSPPANYFC